MKGLAGKKILVTREQAQSQALSRQIVLAGGIPVEVPLLTIHCDQRSEDKPIWNRLYSYKWLFFTSANGVDCFFKQLAAQTLSTEHFASAKIAVVGHKTEAALKAYGVQADFIPSHYNADTMANEFLRQHPRPGTVLLVRGNRSRDVLPVAFAKENIGFDSIEVYRTAFNTALGSKLMDTLQQNDFNYLTFTSPSSVEAFVELGGKPEAQTASICCIGTTTSRKAEAYGFQRILIPDQFTIEGMVEVMEQDAAGRKE